MMADISTMTWLEGLPYSQQKYEQQILTCTVFLITVKITFCSDIRIEIFPEGLFISRMYRSDWSQARSGCSQGGIPL